MSKKKKDKVNEEENLRGATWDGYYTRLTKTKREKKIQEDRKQKQRRQNEW